MNLNRMRMDTISTSNDLGYERTETILRLAWFHLLSSTAITYPGTRESRLEMGQMSLVNVTTTPLKLHSSRSELSHTTCFTRIEDLVSL